MPTSRSSSQKSSSARGNNVPFAHLPTYTVRQLEAKAMEYLAKNFGQDVPIPVDIDVLVERTEGIDLDEWPRLRSNHEIEGGRVAGCPDGPVVYLCRRGANGGRVSQRLRSLPDDRGGR